MKENSDKLKRYNHKIKVKINFFHFCVSRTKSNVFYVIETLNIISQFDIFKTTNKQSHTTNKQTQIEETMLIL